MFLRPSLLALMLVLTVVVCGQARLGIRAGASVSAPNVNSQLFGNLDPVPSVGWTASVFAHIPIGASGLYLSPELSMLTYAYEANGSTVLPGQGLVSLIGDSRIAYGAFPVHLGVELPIGKARLFLEAGSYLAIGLFGENNLTVTISGQSIANKGPIKFGDASGEIKRMDYGISSAAGVQFGKKLSLRLQFVNGFPNISNESIAEFRNRYLGLSLGYVVIGRKAQ